MKRGYSLLLSEYIDANNLEYKDCQYFQVVCPACHEPVFKVMRDTPASSLHYLSHYQSSQSLDTDCELRVKGMSQDKIDETNTASREQKLRLFLSVLQRAVLTTVWEHANRRDIRGRIRKMQKRRSLAEFRDRFLASIKRGAVLDDFTDNCDFYYREQGKGQTAYMQATQVRIARDVLEHLISSNARSSFDFLFNSSVLYLAARLESSYKSGQLEEQPKRLLDFVSVLGSGSETRIREAIRAMTEETTYPPFSIEPMPYLQKFAGEVSHEMIGALLRLPYFDILKENLSERNVEV